MDEPTAGVDAASQEALARTLARLVGQGLTLVVVTHEIGPLLGLLTRVVVLREGRIVPGRAAGARPAAWSTSTRRGGPRPMTAHSVAAAVAADGPDLGLLHYAFMRRALLASVLVGITAPVVGIYLVQRRLALIGDGLGHVALTGVALGLLTGRCAGADGTRGRRGRRGRDRAGPGPRPHQRRRALAVHVLRRHRGRRPAHRPVPGGHPGQPQRVPVRRDHHDHRADLVDLRRARRRGRSW